MGGQCLHSGERVFGRSGDTDAGASARNSFSPAPTRFYFLDRRSSTEVVCAVPTERSRRTLRLNESPFSAAIVTSVPTCPITPTRMRGFPQRSNGCGGFKNRRLAECKISIAQVLISRTLSVCGEVAERLKAAVC